MSRGPENNFISSVHKHLPVKLYRMKNHNQYNGGIADVWYSGCHEDWWIEYKFITIPKRADTVIDLVGGKNPMLSGLQQEWLDSRYEEGRNIGVIAGSKDGGVWFPGTSWHTPITAGQFRERLIDRKGVAGLIVQLTGGPM